jgi:hypothetical protein
MAVIWWEGAGGGVVRKLDLGRRWVDAQVVPMREARSSETLSGIVRETRLRSRNRVTFESAPFTSYDTLDEVEAMINALRRGGRISVAEEEADAYAAFSDPWIDSDQLDVYRSQWALYGGTLAELDRLTVQGPSPRGLEETTLITALPYSGGTVIQLGGALEVRDQTNTGWPDEAWQFVRKPGFWPVMVLPTEFRSEQLVIHKHRRHFTLRLTLDEDIAAIDAMSSILVTLQGTTDTGKPTLMEHLADLGVL